MGRPTQERIRKDWWWRSESMDDDDLLEIFDEARFFDKIDVWHTLVHERERERGCV